MRNQIYASTLGHVPFTLPDLHNIEFQGDRGYFSKHAFIGILLLTDCVLTCTCPKGKSLPFGLGNVPMEDDNRRVVMLEEGLMTCEVRETVFQTNNCEIRTAITAYRNGNEKVILAMPTIYR
jgi:hypothetical protein